MDQYYVRPGESGLASSCRVGENNAFVPGWKFRGFCDFFFFSIRGLILWL